MSFLLEEIGLLLLLLLRARGMGGRGVPNGSWGVPIAGREWLLTPVHPWLRARGVAHAREPVRLLLLRWRGEGLHAVVTEIRPARRQERVAGDGGVACVRCGRVEWIG